MTVVCALVWLAWEAVAILVRASVAWQNEEVVLLAGRVDVGALLSITRGRSCGRHVTLEREAVHARARQLRVKRDDDVINISPPLAITRVDHSLGE